MSASGLVLVVAIVWSNPRPLHIAARTGLVKVVQELVKRGTDLSAKDCDGQLIRGNDLSCHMIAFHCLRQLPSPQLCTQSTGG